MRRIGVRILFIVALVGALSAGADVNLSTQPATIDLSARLDVPIESVSLDGLTLPKAIATISEKAQLNLIPDWRAIDHGPKLDEDTLQGTYYRLTARQLIAIAFTLARVEQPQLIVGEKVIRVAPSDHEETEVIHLGPRLLAAIRDGKKFQYGPFDNTYSGWEGLKSLIDDTAFSPDDTRLSRREVMIFLERLVVRDSPERLARIHDLLRKLENALAQ